MSEGEDKTSSAVKEVVDGKREGEKKEAENYYVRLATNMVTTAKETRLVEDDTQDTFLKGEKKTRTCLLCFISVRGSWCRSCLLIPWSGWSSDKARDHFESVLGLKMSWKEIEHIYMLYL